MGGNRGRLISASDREEALNLINEAVGNGATVEAACAKLHINKSTYYRWSNKMQKSGTLEDERISAQHPIPQNKLLEEELEQIDKALAENPDLAPAHKNHPPCSIHRPPGT